MDSSNILLKEYPRLKECVVQLSGKVVAPIDFPSAVTTELLEEGEVFLLTGKVIEYHPIINDIYKRNGGPRFARLSFEASSYASSTVFWIPVRFTFRGPDHRFYNQSGKVLTPEYFTTKQ